MSVKALKQWVRQTAAKTVWAYGPDKLVRHLKACGVVPGCTLIVHSSWLPFNGFQGKPADVVRALKEAVGPEGLDGVNVRGGRDLQRLIPRGTHQAALASRTLVGAVKMFGAA